jgi:hypothetical protein
VGLRPPAGYARRHFTEVQDEVSSLVTSPEGTDRERKRVRHVGGRVVWVAVGVGSLVKTARRVRKECSPRSWRSVGGAWIGGGPLWEWGRGGAVGAKEAMLSAQCGRIQQLLSALFLVPLRPVSAARVSSRFCSHSLNNGSSL